MNGLRKLFANIEDLDAAKADASIARARLKDTVEEIQARITPSNLLEEAISGVRTRSTEMMESASRTARERPRTVVAAATGLALLLARKPLGRLATKLLRRGEETPDADHQFSS
jgi:ElaB/YqjD/DUF883 family membrane-anchored ribosome-binding protein